MQGLPSKLQIWSSPSQFPGESQFSCCNPWWDKMFLFLPLFLLYHFLIHFRLVDPQEYNLGHGPTTLVCEELLRHGRADQRPHHSWSSDRSFPRLKGLSSHTGGGRNCLAVMINLYAHLPPANQGHLILGQCFISSMTISVWSVNDNKMNICLGHTGMSPLQTIWEITLQAPEPLHTAETHWLRLCSSEFTMIHSQRVSCVFSKMFKMSSFAASQGFECEVRLVYRRCFICIYWMNEWVNGESSHAVVLKLAWALEPPGGLVKTQIAVPPPPSRVSDSVGLRWGLRICIYNRLPGNREAADPETTFWEPLM